MPSRYTFSEYSTDWPAEFEREAERLRGLLGDNLITVHHIGSTSVPGLPAKPTIDLLPVVDEIEQVDEREAGLTEAGYKAWGEYGLSGRRLFTKDRDNTRTHNIHVYECGNPDILRHVAFSRYLKCHPRVADEYAAVKRVAYQHHPADIEAYNDAKSDWIRRVERLAQEWLTQQSPDERG